MKLNLCQSKISGVGWWRDEVECEFVVIMGGRFCCGECRKLVERPYMINRTKKKQNNTGRLQMEPILQAFPTNEEDEEEVRRSWLMM